MVKLFLIITCFLIKLVLNQLNEFTIGSEVKEEITKQKYYMLNLKEEDINTNEYLVIYVKPSDDYEEFSDPDLYVSKKNTYPNSYYTSEWRSTRLGRDIISIPTEELKNTTQLYVGIDCRNKCKYIMKVEYEDMILLNLNENGILNFGNETNAIMKYKHDYNVSKLFEIFSVGTKTSDYQMRVYYVLGNDVEKEITSFISWNGGYSSLIDTNQYYDCIKCYFKIIMTCVPYSKIFLGVRTANSTKTLEIGNDHYGSLEDNMMDCYKFEGKNNESYIFYGNAFRNTIRVSLTKDPNSDENTNDYTFNYDMIYKFNFSDLENKYICIRPAQNGSDFYTSYMFNIFYEDEIEKRRGFAIFAGVPQKGYLPAGMTTTYFDWANTVDYFKTMSLNLQVRKGNPIMYGYFCKYPPCHFNKESIKDNRNLIKTARINNNYNLVITSADNTCKDDPQICHTIMVVTCDGDTECEFVVSIAVEKEHSLITERLKISKMIERGSTDYYKFYVSDKDALKVGVILHSHVGDADLIVSRKFEDPKLDNDPAVSSSAGNRDVVEYVKKENGINTNLDGDYYVAVDAYTFAFYTIYYYVISKPAIEIFDSAKIIESGLIYPDIISRNDTIKYYRFFNKETQHNNSYSITFNSINCEGKLSLINEKLEILENISNIDEHNQLIITSKNNNYLSSSGYLLSYQVKELDSGSMSLNETCLFYIAGTEMGHELMLNEGVPHIFTLSSNFTTMKYIYPHLSKENPFVFSFYFDPHLYNSFISITITFNDPTGDNIKYETYIPRSIKIDTDKLKQSCIMLQCNIFLTIELKSNSNNTEYMNQNVTYSILAKSFNKKPIYISNNEKVKGAQPPQVFQYYYTDLKKGDKGEIAIRMKSSTAELVAKIVNKDAPREPNADFGKVRLPDLSYTQLAYQKDIQAIKFTSDYTKDCDNGCELYVGIYTNDRSNLEDYLYEYEFFIRLGAVSLPLETESTGTLRSFGDINYYKIDIDRDSDTFVILTEHTNNVEIYINFGDITPTFETHDWELLLGSSDTQSDYVSLFAIGTDDSIISSRKLKNLKDSVFSLAIKSTSQYTNSYSIYTYTEKSIEAIDDPVTLPSGSFTPCVPEKDNDFCYFMINDIQTQENLLFYAKLNGHHNVDVFLTLYAKVYLMEEFYPNRNDIKFRPNKDNCDYDSSKQSDTNYILIDKKDLDNYKNKIIVISLYSTKKASITLYSSLHLLRDSINNYAIINRPYLVYLDKFTQSEFIFTSTMYKQYLVDIHRIYGIGTFQIKNTDEVLNINSHRQAYKLGLNGDRNVVFYPETELAFFVKYKPRTAPNAYDMNIGKAYHYVLYDGSFPMTIDFPLAQSNMNDNTFNFIIEKYESKIKTKDLSLYFFYHDDSFVSDHRMKTFEKRYNSEFDHSMQTGKVIFSNYVIGSDPQFSNFYNRSATITLSNYFSITQEDRKYDMMIANVILFPQNTFKGTLPKNTYISGKIIHDSMNEKHYDYLNNHLYLLSRDHNKEKFILIELSSCLGEINFAIGEMQNDKFKNVTRHEYKSYEQYGKLIIEVKLNDYSQDAYILLTGSKFALVEKQYIISYMIRYNSYTDEDSFVDYKLENKGILTYTFDKDFNIQWGSVTNPDKGLKVESNYVIRLLRDSEFIDNTDSICYTHDMYRYYRVKSSLSMKNNTMEIKSSLLQPNVKYFVSVIAITDENNDNTMLSYTPIQIMIAGEEIGVSVWIIILFIILSIVLVISLYIVYKKYISTKLQLDYEVNDVRNQASIPKSDAELRIVNSARIKEKYTNLNEND